RRPARAAVRRAPRAVTDPALLQPIGVLAARGAHSVGAGAAWQQPGLGLVDPRVRRIFGGPALARRLPAARDRAWPRRARRVASACADFAMAAVPAPAMAAAARCSRAMAVAASGGRARGR